MPRMSKDQIASLKDEYNSGIKPTELLSKYNITKHALYHHVGGKAKKSSQPTETEIEIDDDDLLPTSNAVEDPLIDFDQMMEMPSQRGKNKTGDSIFDDFMGDDDKTDMFHPDNLLSAPTQSTKAPSKSKFSLAGFLNGKGLGKDNKKTPQELKKEEEQKQMKLVYSVRLYLYTFRDHGHLFAALNIENDDKKINKYIQDLYKRKIPELNKLLDFIKFHIRHNNNSVSGNFISSIFFTLVKVLEVILTKMGIDLTGLSDELKNDPDMMSNLKEIEIEITSNKLNIGAKTDVLLKLCTKGLTKFTENKMINKMKSLKSVDSTKIAMDKLNAKIPNNELKEKYNDI